MSLVKRPPASLQSDMDIDDALDRRYNYDNDEDIDPELRLRTVRTAHSAIAESIVADTRQTRRRRRFWAHGARRRGMGTTPRRRTPSRPSRRAVAARRASGGTSTSIPRCPGASWIRVATRW
jgi:phospholipid-translocating ATPase